MDLTILSLLLFTLPGFCFIWTFRHFSNLPKLNDFEYAEWSFLFGTVLFFITAVLGGDKIGDTVIDLNEPLKLFSTALGMGLGTALSASFPLGYVFSFIYNKGLISWINKKLKYFANLK